VVKPSPMKGLRIDGNSIKGTIPAKSVVVFSVK
jgi:hypothetical protein